MLCWFYQVCASHKQKHTTHCRATSQPMVSEDDQENHTPALFPGTLWQVPASNTVAYFLKTGTAVKETTPADDLCHGIIPPASLQSYAALLRQLYAPLLELEANGRDTALAGLLSEVHCVGGALDRAAKQLRQGCALPSPALVRMVRVGVDWLVGRVLLHCFFLTIWHVATICVSSVSVSSACPPFVYHPCPCHLHINRVPIICIPSVCALTSTQPP